MYDNVSGTHRDSGTGFHFYQAATKRKGQELVDTSEKAQKCTYIMVTV